MMAEVIIEAREQMLRDLNEALTIVRRALVMATPKVEADEFKAPVWA